MINMKEVCHTLFGSLFAGCKETQSRAEGVDDATDARLHELNGPPADAADDDLPAGVSIVHMHVDNFV
jgi:hypothetical protein